MDWCQYTAEAIYYALFSMRREDCKKYFLTHFFASRHFNQINLIMAPFAAILAESEIADNKLLPNENQKFLHSAQLLFPLGWLTMTSMPNRKLKFVDEIVPKAKISQIESTLKIWLAQVDLLENGLAKFVGLMCKALRCPSSQQVEVLRHSRKQARFLSNPVFKEFSGNLFFKVGHAFNRISQYEEALTTYGEAIGINPDDSRCWNSKGLVLLSLERYEEALESVEKAIDINPEDSGYWNTKGAVLFDLERYEEALESVEKAIDINPEDSSYWKNKSLALSNLERYEEALESVEKAIDINPEDPNCWNAKGAVLSNSERYEEALESFEKAIDINPEDSNYWKNKSLALSDLERYEEALESFEKAIDMNPENSNYWINKSLALSNLERYEEALESVEKAIDINPEDSGCWNAKGIALTRIRQYVEALESFDHAGGLSPHDSSWKLSRSVLLAWMGQSQEAIKACDDVLEEMSDNSDAFYSKACCYALQNDFQSALHNLEMAIAQERGNNSIKKRARRDPEFNNIRSESRFQVLIDA